MKKITLDSGEWRLAFTHPETLESTECRARVPGNAGADLMRAGILPNLYEGLNARLGKKWERTDFTYSTRFQASPEELGKKMSLVFEGVDTAARIVLNGIEIAYLENMFIPHRIDVSGKLGAENTLVVVIENPIDYAAAQVARHGFDGVELSHLWNHEALYIRKAQHMFGWDIAPRLLFGGIWRGVHLFVHEASELRPEEFYFHTINVDRNKKESRFGFQWAASLDPKTDWQKYSIRIRGECGAHAFEHDFSVSFACGKETLTIPDPKLWWPRGYGDASLYAVAVTLFYDGKTVDEFKTRLGIRSLALDFHEDPSEIKKNRFAFICNGEKIFAKGSNWIPADALHDRDSERIPKILDLFAESHCNMLRAWGGGVYEDDTFFDRCDELGIMVWQDFMLGCAFYPQHVHFQNVIRREAEVIVKKLRNHASLALWAGDNEIDQFLLWRYQGLSSFQPSQNILSREVLKDVVFRLDPCRHYLPSSPYISDERFASGSDSLTPEQHLWGPRGWFKADFYAKNQAVFASEIGYHGSPSRKSIEKFLNPGKVWGDFNNDEWRLHASDPLTRKDSHMARRNFLMRDQITHFFGDTVDLGNFDDFVLASQCTQAEAKKFFIELFRAHKDKRNGILWWNVMDCWPQFSDAVVDYYFEKKLAFDYIRRSQEHVALMFREPRNGKIELVAVNDTLSKVQGAFCVADENGKALASENFSVGENGLSILKTLSSKT
ncbi:MAG: hypothetical protein JNM63_03635, partial [Spirochaetia bacterium]|nr:hypothetical protein [Spirochaetia bacterium]